MPVRPLAVACLAIPFLVFDSRTVTRAADFRDVSANAGFVESGFTYGQAWADFDGDGDRDLLVGRHFLEPLLYRNQGNGLFAATVPPSFSPGDHHGMVVADFDDDGDADVYLTGGVSGGTSTDEKRLYRNDGELAFVDIAVPSGLGDPLGRGRSCSVTDVNGDGALDVFVAKARRAQAPNSLFLNDGSGFFTDVAASAGVADGFGSEGGIWGDYDRDGDPDLFVSGIEHPLSQSALYRNDGSLGFTDVTDAALPGMPPVAAAAWGDYDNDGDLDLAVGRGDEGLFDGVQVDGRDLAFFFNARADESGVDALEFTQGGEEVSFDVMFQGDFDPSVVFISNTGFHPSTNPFTLSLQGASGKPPFVPGADVGMFLWTEGATWHVTCSTPGGIGNNFSGILVADNDYEAVSTSDLEPATIGARGARLFRNDAGFFVDVTSTSGLGDAFNVRDLTWVDFDLDRDLDLHVHNKGDTESSNQRDFLYENENGHFSDVTVSQKFEGPTNGLGDGVSFDDYDGDGDPDAVLLSGASPRFFALQEIHRLYENRNDGFSFLRVDLEGTASTRDGLGAWVTCVTGGVRQVRNVAGNAWRGSQDMMAPLFGLGPSAVVDSLIVEWPSGALSVLSGLAPGTVQVQEPVPVAAPGVAPVSALGLTAAPNPSSGEVLLRIAGARGRCTLDIFTSTGRRLLRRTFDSGTAAVRWDGTGPDRLPVAPGVYHAVVRNERGEASAKIVRVH